MPGRETVQMSDFGVRGKLMADNYQDQIKNIVKECLLLTDLINCDKIKIEYNRNKKLKEMGKIKIETYK